MATQSVLKEKPDTGHAGDSGFLRVIPPPVWMVQAPAPSFEFFDIHTPRFYVIHGTPMAFTREVTP
jgi:hypothetical protein